jgi:hypothetical protein
MLASRVGEGHFWVIDLDALNAVFLFRGFY